MVGPVAWLAHMQPAGWAQLQGGALLLLAFLAFAHLNWHRSPPAGVVAPLGIVVAPAGALVLILPL